MRTIHFNTKRSYGPKGQRITAKLYEPGECGLPEDRGYLVTFNDHDRGIDGQFWTKRPEVSFTERGIMARYDRNDYAQDEPAYHGARPGGANHKWVDPSNR